MLFEGLNLIAQGNFKTLHAQCIEAIKADIKDPIPYFLLGALASEHNNHIKAAELFSTAENYDHSQPYYPAYLAKTLTSLRRLNEARAAADRAAAMIVDDPRILDTVAVAYSRSGFHELAIPLFKRAIALMPEHANIQYNLGASAQFIGNFQLAETSYKKALAIEPNFYRAWASLVYLQKQTAENNALSTLIELFEQNSNNPMKIDAQLQLGHAIAKTHEDLGDFKASLNWLHKAKQGKRAELPYDRDSGGKTFSAAKMTFEKQRSVAQKPALGAHMAQPLFVIGLPRTGTTLVDRILSSHSRVSSAGELNTFAELIKQHAGTESQLVLDAATLSCSSNIDLLEVGRLYLEKSASLARGSDFMVDKMPLNFFYAGLIHKALPHARIISLRRGAMDSCVSNFRQLFSTQYSYYNYTFDLADTAWFYRQYDALMVHWRAVLPADRFMEVHYEEIVFDQQKQTRRLLDFCGLDWQESCLNFHENEAPVSTASSVQVRQALYSGSIGRWKKYGDELAPLEAALAGLDKL